MNQNAVIAVLVTKGVLTREEADRLVDHLHTKPQSANLEDTLRTVSEVLSPPTAPLLGPVGPEQAAEEAIARTTATAPMGDPATPTEFPTLPGANESTGNDLSYSEISDNAKQTNETGNVPTTDARPKSDAKKSTNK